MSSQKENSVIEMSMIEELRGLSPNGDDFIRDLIELFLIDSKQRASNITNALLKEEYKTAQKEAHALKGGASNLGATRVTKEASSVEKALKQGEVNEARQHWEHAQQELEQAFIELEKINRELKQKA